MDGVGLLKVSVALGVLFIAFFLASAVRKKVLGLGERLPTYSKGIANLVANTLYVAVLTVGAVISLGSLGVNVNALITGLGLTGFAVGFALKDIISNILAGALIILYTPFRIGDTIKVGGHEGRVVEINLRYTVIESDEGKVLIPNSTMFTNIITLRKG